MIRQHLLGLCLLALTLSSRAQLPPAPTEPQPVKVVNAVPDESIRTRLAGIFAQVEELRQVKLDVQSGVATLSGEVANPRAREEALALVRRTDGVILVVDRLEANAAVAAQLSPAVEKVREIVRTVATKLPLVGIALIIVVVFWFLGNFLHNRRGWFDYLRLPALARTLVRRMIRILLFGLGLVLALEILDATAIAGAVLGAAGLAGLAIGFAFKNILENYLSGILLSTRNPFEIGDVIEINSRTGKVAMLTARDTVLVTLDGNHLRIPNSVVINSELINYTRNPLRRFEFTVGVSVSLDLKEARRVGLETLARNPGVLADPKPIAIVDQLGDSTVNIKFLAWLDQTQHDFLKTRSESIRMVKEAYDHAGIEMPEPLYRIQIRDQQGQPIATLPSVTTAPKPAPAVKPVTAPTSGPTAVEDISADRTIDRQIEAEQRVSRESNLLSNTADS